VSRALTDRADAVIIAAVRAARPSRARARIRGARLPIFRNDLLVEGTFMNIELTLVLAVGTATVATAQTYPHPIVQPGSARAFADVEPHLPSRGSSHPLTQSFQVVDQLGHQDDFWQNSLVGDANHNGLSEIVLRYTPAGGSGGQNSIVFYEDDGSGNFNEVFSFPLADGGLLAMGDIDDDGLTDLFFERAIGPCNHQFVRWEASSVNGFPDHEVWSATKEGNVVDFRGYIADIDGDGVKEFVTADNNFTCMPTSLKVFESAPNDQMTLTFNQVIGFDLGNPVVADFDLNGKREIVVADAGVGSGVLYDFESTGNDSFQLISTTTHNLYNAYEVALIERYSPDGRPMLFLAGQQGSADYRVQVYERTPTMPTLRMLNNFQIPALCGASIPQIAAADLFGTRTPEIIVDRLCDPVPILSVGAHGVLTLFQAPSITESLEVVATNKTGLHSGAIAVGTFPTSSNPQGKTLVLELQ
jgi:hypothetical protein